MSAFFNIFGSALLILSGVGVLIYLVADTIKRTEPKKSQQLPSRKFKSEDWVRIALIALVARWLIYLIAYRMIGTTASFSETIYQIFSNSGDSPHYLHLAEHGYVTQGENAKLIVFYPLYPLIIRIFNLLTQDYLASGVIVSNLAFMAASCVLYKLLRLDYNEEQSASGLALMIVAPFSMFYSAVFTESVFLLTTVLCLYFMRTKKPIQMGICGFLACLSRTQGIILFVCALASIVSDMLQKKKCNRKGLVGALIIPIGFLVYLLMNKVLFDYWFQYLAFQAAPPWYNKAQWFGITLSDSYNMAQSYPFLANIIYWPQLILFFIGTLCIFYGIYQKVRVEYLIYLGAYIFTCYSHGWLISGSRYMCACVPLYIVFASTKNKYIRYLIIAISAVLCFIYTGMWLRGESIM